MTIDILYNVPDLALYTGVTPRIPYDADVNIKISLVNTDGTAYIGGLPSDLAASFIVAADYAHPNNPLLRVTKGNVAVDLDYATLTFDLTVSSDDLAALITGEESITVYAAVDLYEGAAARPYLRLPFSLTVLGSIEAISDPVALPQPYAYAADTIIIKGAWGGTTSYVAGDAVTYSGGLWWALLPSSGQTPASGSSYWYPLTGIGPAGNSWHLSDGEPVSGLGSDNDLCLDSGSGFYYHKVSGAWVGVGSLVGLTGATGPQGTKGTTGNNLEFRFYTHDSYSGAPDYDSGADDPGSGWSGAPYGMTAGTYLWFTTSTWSTSTRLTIWSEPTCLSPYGEFEASGTAYDLVSGHNIDPNAHGDVFELSGVAYDLVSGHDIDASAHPGTFDLSGIAYDLVSGHDIDTGSHAGIFELSGVAYDLVSGHDIDASAHPGTFDLSGVAYDLVSGHDIDASAHPGIFDLSGVAYDLVSGHDVDTGSHAGIFELSGVAYTLVNALLDVDTKTDTYNVALSDHKKVLVMDAGTEKSFNLPSVSGENAGLMYTFVRLSSGKLNVDPADSDVISDGGAGAPIYSDVEGQLATLTLVLVSETQWAITAVAGTWITTD